jgi:phage terminase small subunit
MLYLVPMTAQRKTITLKKVQGTERPERQPVPLKKIGTVIPDPVFEFTPEERDVYNQLATHLQDYELLHTVDAVGLSTLTKNIMIMKWTADQLRGPDDVVQHFDNGTSNVSGIYTAYTKAQQSFTQLMSKWGLSPVDREKIAGMLLDNEEDDYDAIKNQ